MDNHMTNITTKTATSLNVQNWIQDKEINEIKTIAPNATKYLKEAGDKQTKIGWDPWIKHRWLK
jgi:hypothetical protein